MKLHLTEDQADDLKLFVEEDENYKTLLKVTEQLVALQLQALATVNEDQLIRERNILEGMKKLQRNLIDLKKFLSR